MEAKTFDLCFPEHVRERHTLILGKTGSGKTTKILTVLMYGDLLNQESTVVVIDAKGDLTSVVLEMAEKARGKRANVIYFSPLEPLHSIRWNPFDGLSDRGGCQEIAQCLSFIDKSTTSDGTYFKVQGTKLVTDLLHVHIAAGSPINPAGLKRLLDLPADAIVKDLQRSGVSNIPASLIYAVRDNKNAETTITVAENLCEAFADPRISATTSQGEFKFDMLSDQPCVFIYRCPEGSSRLASLTTVFLSRLLAWTVDCANRHGGSLPRPMNCYVDEFASSLAAPIPIEDSIHTSRSRKCFFTVAVQSLGQVRERYGPGASALLDGFGTLIAVPPLGLADAQFLSERSATCRYLEFQTAGPDDPRIIAEREVLRHVLSPEEIANPRRHPDKGLLLTILLPELPPLLGYACPIWQLPGFETWNRTQGGAMPDKQVPKRKRKAEPAVEAVKPTGHTELQPGITDTRGMSEREIRKLLRATMAKIGWADTTGSAKKWWEAFMQENDQRVSLILRLAEELANRNATITEFFLAYVYSNTNNIMANLLYLDYTRAKKEEEAKRRKAARDDSEVE
ncbi:MAG: type IV secretory system conjugative DNA transfer family protein [Methanoregulaceae archaeon]|nr:type IV secretory system conjugative DNA transfer family protein [Methanoregulaceae archaeon]